MSLNDMRVFKRFTNSSVLQGSQRDPAVFRGIPGRLYWISEGLWKIQVGFRSVSESPGSPKGVPGGF